jgi:carbon-monoxide dehydrogenase medium subunit
VKIAPLAYKRPRTLADAIGILAEHGGDAKVLSGGQSIMPLLALRLAAVKVLVDLKAIPGLDQIDARPEFVEIGAKVRWRDIETSALLKAAHPLLVAAVRHVAHYQIRNRGTVGGSLAHADPAAELPAVAVACDGIVMVQGAAGPRSIPAHAFFQGPLTTALAFDEIITALRLPVWPAGRRCVFEEFARRRGDFALAGVIAHYDVVAGKAGNARVAGFGIADTPIRLAAVEAALEGQPVGAEAVEIACRTAERSLEPISDLQADAQYRKALFVTLLRRGLEKTLRGESP